MGCVPEALDMSSRCAPSGDCTVHGARRLISLPAAALSDCNVDGCSLGQYRSGRQHTCSGAAAGHTYTVHCSWTLYRLCWWSPQHYCLLTSFLSCCYTIKYVPRRLCVNSGIKLTYTVGNYRQQLQPPRRNGWGPAWCHQCGSLRLCGMDCLLCGCR